YLWQEMRIQLNISARAKLLLSLAAGSILGLVAGIAGIGGGVYLIPLIIILGLGTTKEAAASGTIFIFINSISGIAARLQYNRIDISEYLPMIIAVIIGGLLGSHLGAVRYKPRTMEKILGIIIVIAIVLLMRRLY
ncbi:MAG: TSUP family transporter, partial [Gammaproteobacteria bacterium]|nr:TSUP family transporter [Gammaproteobacteria bacterium]